MKIIFMGTPDFSVGTLEALVEAGHEVVLAVTQPDKPKGRGKEMQFTPVKECALKYNIPVYQPRRVREAECIEELRKYEADIMVVVAFGQILPKEILEMTKYGCVNVHASLLPKYRGAAPIQWSIIDGEEVTGVTTMQMNEGLDTGDMLLKVEIPIEEKETGGSLHDKLAEAGAKLCDIILPDCEFVEDEISEIKEAVKYHRKDADKNKSKLAELLRWADKNSRCCFECAAISECNWSFDKLNMEIEY